MFSFNRQFGKKELAEAVHEAIDRELKERGVLLAQRRRAGRPRRGQKVVQQSGQAA